MTLEHRSKIGKFLSYSLLTLIAIAFLFPFAWMLASSLKPTSEVFSSGASLTGTRLAWDNYTEATQQIPLGRIILNSILVSTCGAALTMAVSLLSAYAFARLRFRFRDHLFMLFLGTLVLPQEARIDGAGDLKILWHILIPLLKAPILVVGVFSFIDYWSTFLWPLIVVNDADLATISLGLQMFSGERGTDWGPMMAAVSMSVIPSFFIVAFLQSQLEKGVTLGAFGGR